MIFPVPIHLSTSTTFFMLEIDLLPRLICIFFACQFVKVLARKKNLECAKSI